MLNKKYNMSKCLYYNFMFNISIDIFIVQYFMV